MCASVWLLGEHVEEAPTTGPSHGQSEYVGSQQSHHLADSCRLTAWRHVLLLLPVIIHTLTYQRQVTCQKNAKG